VAGRDSFPASAVPALDSAGAGPSHQRDPDSDDTPGPLAEKAGVLLGVAPGRVPQERERFERMAQLVIDSGADVELIPHWRRVAAQRAEAAKAVPYTGSRH
jgi:hypothetical protein